MKLKTFLEKTDSEVVIYVGTNLVEYNPDNYVYIATTKKTYTPVENEYLETKGIELTQEILNSEVESFEACTIDFEWEEKAVIEVYVN